MTLLYANRLINKLPACINKGKTPLEVWSSHSVIDWDHLHVFCCLVYYHIRESNFILKPRKHILGL